MAINYNGNLKPAATAIPGMPGVPGLPDYSNIAGVNELFDPNFGRTETITTGAENAIAGGFGMGGFAQNQTNRLLDSERKSNYLAGHQILEPYLQRDFQGAQSAADRQGRLDQIAAEGAQALQRLQLSEAGQGQRLSAELEARLRQQVLEGDQAMQRLVVTEAGDTSRLNTTIGGNLANTYLSSVLSGKGGTGPVRGGVNDSSTSYTGPGNMTTDFGSGNSIVGWRPRDDANARTSGGTLRLGSSSIDIILRKYGLL